MSVTCIIFSENDNSAPSDLSCSENNSPSCKQILQTPLNISSVVIGWLMSWMKFITYFHFEKQYFHFSYHCRLNFKFIFHPLWLSHLSAWLEDERVLQGINFPCKFKNKLFFTKIVYRNAFLSSSVWVKEVLRKIKQITRDCKTKQANWTQSQDFTDGASYKNLKTHIKIVYKWIQMIEYYKTYA